ncbi:hypothetical protein K0M31_015701 [Melipona bicolor]|uniref:Uncharacterized protein n=1 Tax=Melipona bicolor TaxID=60889 RepID=A0AA40FEY5_9HYME|nr:hypothetical protein K0M31_015701 [Melipona bicolor]
MQVLGRVLVLETPRVERPKTEKKRKKKEEEVEGTGEEEEWYGRGNEKRETRKEGLGTILDTVNTPGARATLPVIEPTSPISTRRGRFSAGRGLG